MADHILYVKIVRHVALGDFPTVRDLISRTNVELWTPNFKAHMIKAMVPCAVDEEYPWGHVKTFVWLVNNQTPAADVKVSIKGVGGLVQQVTRRLQPILLLFLQEHQCEHDQSMSLWSQEMSSKVTNVLRAKIEDHKYSRWLCPNFGHREYHALVRFVYTVQRLGIRVEHSQIQSLEEEAKSLGCQNNNYLMMIRKPQTLQDLARQSLRRKFHRLVNN